MSGSLFFFLFISIVVGFVILAVRARRLSSGYVGFIASFALAVTTAIARWGTISGTEPTSEVVFNTIVYGIIGTGIAWFLRKVFRKPTSDDQDVRG